MTGNENFLSRWSRLKREPEPEQEKPEVEETAPEHGAAASEGPAPGEDLANAAAVSADPDTVSGAGTSEPHPAELIDIDSLTKHSDFSAFVKKGVPAALQRKALRKLWTLDPVLANLDGLNDYENIIEDFGITDLKPGGSGWKVGRCFMTDEDFALINERGGYKPPEADEPEEAGTQVLAEDGDADDDETQAPDTDTVAQADADDEFDVGGGDDNPV